MHSTVKKTVTLTLCKTGKHVGDDMQSLSPDNVVIVRTLRVGLSKVRITAEARDFYFLHDVQTGSGAHPAIQWVPRGGGLPQG